MDARHRGEHDGEGVILGRGFAATRESPDEKALVSEMLGSSPSMTALVALHPTTFSGSTESVRFSILSPKVVRVWRTPGMR